MKNHTESIISNEYTYTVIFERADEGGYVVVCPALPGVATQGETLKEAREMVKEAIEGYLEILREDGEPIPIEDYQEEPISEKVTVELKTA